MSGTQPHEPDAWAVIPARYASTRLPGKPLADDTGKPLIQHVVERVRRAKSIGRVIVATDDPRIAEAVERGGSEAVLTAADHPNGTSRIGEALAQLDDDHEADDTADAGAKNAATQTAQRIIVNVQGDEPEIAPRAIDTLVEALTRQPQTPMATLGSPITDPSDTTNPNIVKLVRGLTGQALYFSRAALPYNRDQMTHPAAGPLKHLGVYAYRRWFINVYAGLTPTPLEQTEQLEQLRVLEHGYPIAVQTIDSPHPGIDTPEQYQAFVQRHRQGT